MSQDTKRAAPDLMDKLHELAASEMLRWLEREGGATSQEMGAILKFLKDNGVNLANPGTKPRLTNLRDKLPFDDGDPIPFASGTDG